MYELFSGGKLRKQAPQPNPRVKFTKRSLPIEETTMPKNWNEDSKTPNFMNFKSHVSDFISSSRRKRSTNEVYADTEVRWTYPYYDCSKQKWLASVTVFNKEQ